MYLNGNTEHYKNPIYPKLIYLCKATCWRRSLRGHDRQLTHELDPGKWSSSLLLGMDTLLPSPTVGVIFKDVALRELGVVEIIWTICVTKPS